MTDKPRTVVIPFGVPEDGKGLGLGLAAVFHGLARFSGQPIGLAQMWSRTAEASPNKAVEAFMPPPAWQEFAKNGSAPDVDIVITGGLELPTEGKGMLELLAYEARQGFTKARAHGHVDVERAGLTLVSIMKDLVQQLGGELASTKPIEELTWESLESVLRAERCVLFDPMRGGPHDRLAALVHLGRAVSDAPEAKYPAGRLAAVAVEAVVSGDRRAADAALRALERATTDAPAQADLVEALAALLLRLGRAPEAEVKASSAIGLAPDRARLHALVSEARRVQGNLDGALEAIARGQAVDARDPQLGTERGCLLAARGDKVGAVASWRTVLDLAPGHPPAFHQWAAFATEQGDTATMDLLVDHALSVKDAHPEILRRSLSLLDVGESPGVARASRTAAVCRAILDRIPEDLGAVLILARSLAQMNEKEAALEKLRQIEAAAPQTTFAAEAQRGVFAVLHSDEAAELDATLRAAIEGPAAALETVAVRSRRIFDAHGVWTAAFAAGVARRRLQDLDRAYQNLRDAIRVAPGALPAYVELTTACIGLGKNDEALGYATRLHTQEDNAVTASNLAAALLATGDRPKAKQMAERALQMDPSHADATEILKKVDSSTKSWIDRLLRR